MDIEDAIRLARIPKRERQAVPRRQHAAIVEWWGPYDTLGAVRDEIEKFEDGQYLLCMALREEDSGGRMRCRHLKGWVHHIIDERDRHRLPDECARNDDGRPSELYLGW